MNKKIVGIFICMLLIGSSFITMGNVVDNVYIKQNFEKEIDKANYKTSQNGMILDQVLDENGKGYSVISIWGSYYEMGYAQAELIGDYIVKAVNENKEYVGNNYNQIRELMSEAIWMPQDTEDEFEGMVDCLTITHPSENIDILDLKVLNTVGDWAYGIACRSHTCWGEYVSEPIKTLSTRRLDFNTPYSSANHHVLCARNPDDGSVKWVNLAAPGFVLVTTCVNEYGILVSLHDYNSYTTDFSSNTMPRMVASRYAATYSSGSDVSTYLTSCYSDLQNYEIMVGSFINYYAPEGNGGVMTCNQLQSGADFYNLRIPQATMYNGEAMITTNQWTDGTYTPSDEDFGADDFYDDESSKTLESHWDLLHYDGAGNRGLHHLSVAYRNREDMTIWFDGRLSNIGKRTPRLEWEWEDLFSEPPLTPEINGPTSGNVGEEQVYTFNAIDPDGDNIYYCIDWGDNSGEVCIGPFPSGEEQTSSHTWDEEGTYIIRAKTRDIHNAESDWVNFEVTMPKNKMENYQKPFHTMISNNNVLCPILLAITLGFALNALKALESIPEDIQYWIDFYNEGRINALELLIEIVSCTTMDVINALYAKAGFRFFYNLWHDLCTGPSLGISAPSLTRISDLQVLVSSYTISTLKIPTNRCRCDQ
jgi:hypothetical protein